MSKPNKQPDVTIPFELPTLNEIIAVAKQQRGRRSLYNSLKKKNQQAMEIFIRQAEPITKPVKLEFHWYRENRRTNPDNICAGGRKFALDAMQIYEILQDDNWKWIRGFKDEFDVDKTHPRVEIFYHFVIE